MIADMINEITGTYNPTPSKADITDMIAMQDEMYMYNWIGSFSVAFLSYLPLLSLLAPWAELLLWLMAGEHSFGAKTIWAFATNADNYADRKSYRTFLGDSSNWAWLGSTAAFEDMSFGAHTYKVIDYSIYYLL